MMRGGALCGARAAARSTRRRPRPPRSGPSLNILIKLMAVESLVFAPFFFRYTRDGLLLRLIGQSTN